MVIPTCDNMPIIFILTLNTFYGWRNFTAESVKKLTVISRFKEYQLLQRMHVFFVQHIWYMPCLKNINEAIVLNITKSDG